jgi:transcriptional regulator with XRE-family HTH domain
MPYYVKNGGATLRAWRRRAGLTQEELADEAGVAVNTVSNAECGWPVRRSTVRKIARVLIAEPRELARWHDE